MFAVEKAPGYVEATLAAAARLQERTTPARYAGLVDRAERLLDALFTIEVDVERELMVKIALRERFEPARVRRAILMVATHRLVAQLARAWSAGERVEAGVPQLTCAADSR